MDVLSEGKSENTVLITGAERDVMNTPDAEKASDWRMHLIRQQIIQLQGPAPLRIQLIHPHFPKHLIWMENLLGLRWTVKAFLKSQKY